VNKIFRAPEEPHLKYLHLYAIVRLDADMSVEKCATVVKILPTADQAETEAARLREVNKGKNCIYSVQTTRLVGASLIAES
jgi:hypothetical protein